MLNKPPEYMPDYARLLEAMSISLGTWKDTFNWVCNAEGTQMEVKLIYGRLQYDKNGELIIIGTNTFEMQGKIKYVSKKDFTFSVIDKDSISLILSHDHIYDTGFCTCWISKNNDYGTEKVVPSFMSFCSLETGAGRSVDREDQTGIFGTMCV